MPVLNRDESMMNELAPGVLRQRLVDSDLESDSLTVADLTVSPDASVPTHIHPTEEAMVILAGNLDAIIGDQIVQVSEGQTVIAPPNVRHGFVNKSGSDARVMAIFPTARMERTFVD
jgi:quercetin dioxygenase-like cupin family protein|tara:strand:- start:973 stop:1323 length:351 start_codon:yes stop_codon:yes gene_type:complete